MAALLVLSASFGGQAIAQQLSNASPPSDRELAQLCSAHPSDCNCPGCRAFFNACDQMCPPGMQGYTSDLSDAYPSDGIAEAVPAEDDAGSATSQPTTVTGPTTAIPAGLGAVAASRSAAPSMIGDFIGGGYRFLALSTLDGATVAVAGGDIVPKFAENSSPLPTDRIFFNYNLFVNSVVDVNGVVQDANRFNFGIEKTFWSGLGSLELRLPFTASVSAAQQDGMADTMGAEFGNMLLTVKLLAYESERLAVAGGLGIVFPTAQDAIIRPVGGGVPAIIYDNDAFYLQPFLGLYHRPTERLFHQFVSQVSFDTSGSELTVTDTSFFGSTGVDRIHDQTLLFLDYSIGYWIYRSPCNNILTGVAPMLELHYTSTLDDLEQPTAIAANVFEADLRRDALNLTAGVFVELGRYTGVKLAGVAPLREGTNRFFDSEFALQVIHRY